MDSYQAVYDATRSRISPCDGHSAIESVAREAFSGIGNLAPHAQQEIYAVSHEMQRPSVIYRPSISADGNMWRVLLGEDLQSGVVGFGETPAKAMAAFDTEFWKGQTPAAIRLAKEQPAMEKTDV